MSKGEDRSVVFSALEVANLCGVVNQTAINWIKSGHLKAFKTPGGQFRVYPDDLAVFMKERKMRIPDDLLVLCSSNSTEFHPVKILFVDDDKSFNDVSVAFMNKNLENTEIFQAFDGFEAGTMLANKRPDCVVLDLNLPGIDGIKICSIIKKSEAFGNPEVIIVTSLEDEGAENKCRDLGVKYYFKKPVMIPSLVDAIKESMGMA